ncbi:unnamed protein product [Prunus armeniaca]|uniref:Protein kinase domain-containing protein n=2 Tax=Prunus armeniaca TaxID=36596 RepID=A0A6J5U9B1_PRUAR|nr:unnamed protein product [Prunus armeniaca]
MLSCFRNKKYKTKEEGCFLKNGAAMLEQLIHSFYGNCNPIRMYSKEELKKATNDYCWDGMAHRDWNSRLYKGVHEDHGILVKKFEADSSSYMDPLELITNEAAVASNMSKHKNVLKLLGCCLECELPMLVYEFPAKGNLSHHIYGDGQSLQWQIRLKIAIEVADAVAYLHYGMPKMIIHRDIKAGHVFLDQDYVAKLSEFRTSVPIPLGKTHVDVEVITGTHSCLPPEYAISGRTSEKSDVHSFGILLCEIFAGKRWDSLLIWFMENSNKGSSSSYNELEFRQLANLFKTYLEANVLEEENKKQVVECAKLIERCLKTNPDDRPIMTEVAQSLRLIKSL